jgi:hypothetical protein
MTVESVAMTMGGAVPPVGHGRGRGADPPGMSAAQRAGAPSRNTPRLETPLAGRTVSSAIAGAAKISDAPAALAEAAAEPGQPPRAQSADSEPGVLRLLEAGHFKGVADVRLRINFFDELSARAASGTGAQAKEGTAELTETIAGQLDALIGALNLDAAIADAVNALRAEFAQAANEAAASFAAQGAGDKESLAEAIRSAFNTLVHELGSLLSPPEPSPDDDDQDIDPELPIPEMAAVDDPASEDDPAEGSTFDVDAALAGLRNAFEESLSSLLNALESTLRPADPAPPPHNQGVAYAKFLAIYNELRGVNSTVDAIG